MLKIKDGIDIKELEKFGFYLEGNTYKYDISNGKCVAVCIYDRIIIEPQLPIMHVLSYRKFYMKVYNLTLDLIQAGLVEKI